MLFNEASDIIHYERQRLAFHLSDCVMVDVRAYNSQNLLDYPRGFLTCGRNGSHDRFKGEMVGPFSGGHYRRLVRIESNDTTRFSQLVVDFVTGSTISINAGKPYDSYLIVIPFRVDTAR